MAEKERGERESNSQPKILPADSLSIIPSGRHAWKELGALYKSNSPAKMKTRIRTISWHSGQSDFLKRAQLRKNDHK